MLCWRKLEEESLEARINRATNPLNKEQSWEDVEAFCHQLNRDLEGYDFHRHHLLITSADL